MRLRSFEDGSAAPDKASATLAWRSKGRTPAGLFEYFPGQLTPEWSSTALIAP